MSVVTARCETCGSAGTVGSRVAQSFRADEDGVVVCMSPVRFVVVTNARGQVTAKHVDR